MSRSCRGWVDAFGAAGKGDLAALSQRMDKLDAAVPCNPVITQQLWPFKRLTGLCGGKETQR